MFILNKTFYKHLFTKKEEYRKENKLTSPTAQTDTGLAYNQIMEERSRFIMSVTVLYTLYTKSAGAINLALVWRKATQILCKS